MLLVLCASKQAAVCWCCKQLFILTSVHISLTFSRIMLQCLSNAFTRPSSLWLLRQLISTCAYCGSNAAPTVSQHRQKLLRLLFACGQSCLVFQQVNCWAAVVVADIFQNHIMLICWHGPQLNSAPALLLLSLLAPLLLLQKPVPALPFLSPAG